MASYRSDQATQGSQRFSHNSRPTEAPSMSRSRLGNYTQDPVNPVNVTIAARASLSTPVVRPVARDHTTLIRSVDGALAAGYTTSTTGSTQGPTSRSTADPIRGVGARF